MNKYINHSGGCKWYWYDYNLGKFSELGDIPKLKENFAGIGSAKLNENGVNAIKEVYKFNFKNINEFSTETKRKNV